jgi:tetratricopeptide (TPR) repeat protein
VNSNIKENNATVKNAILYTLIILILLLLVPASGCQQQLSPHYECGLTLAKEGHYEQALEEFSMAIEIDSKFGEAYAWRGWCYINKGEYDNAITDLTKAVKLDSSLEHAWNMRGYVYRLKKEYDKAISDYTKAIEIDPNYSWSFPADSCASYTVGAKLKTIAGFELSTKLSEDPSLFERTKQEIEELQPRAGRDDR